MTDQNNLPKYFRPEPKLNGWMFWVLIIPCGLYVLGVIFYSGLAMVATNGHSTDWQKAGSVLMVIGGEATTLFAVMEVFRKRMTIKEVREKKSWWTQETREIEIYEDSFWDWLGMFVSLIATLGALFVVFTRQTSIDAPWVSWTIVYGPLVLLLCSGLDMYAASMEIGMMRASWEKRWNKWNDARHAWIRTELTRQDKLAREQREHDLEMVRESSARDENRVEIAQPDTETAPDRLSRSAWRKYVNGEGRLRPDIQEARTAANGRQVELINQNLASRGFATVPASTARDWATDIPEKE